MADAFPYFKGHSGADQLGAIDTCVKVVPQLPPSAYTLSPQVRPAVLFLIVETFSNILLIFSNIFMIF